MHSWERQSVLAVCIVFMLALPTRAQDQLGADVIEALVSHVKNKSSVWQGLAQLWDVEHPTKILPQNTMLPMRDGVKLFTEYYVSDRKERPTVLIRSPYGKAGTENLAYLYTPAGFNVVMQNQRGTGSSEGDWTFWANTPDDGYDTMKWITTQDWSNGQVYQMGASADGILAYLDMMEPQPALKGQWLIFSNSLLYKSCFQDMMAHRQQLVHHWLGHMQKYRPNASSYEDYVLAHEGFDSTPTWKDATLTNLSNVNFPSVHLAGWYDIFLQPMLETVEHYNTQTGPLARGKQQLIVGPRGHCFLFQKPQFEFKDDTFDFVWAYEASLRVFRSDELQSPRAQSLLEDSLSAKLDQYTFYIMGSQKSESDSTTVGNYWTTLPQYPTPKPRKLYLTSSESLSPQTPASSDEISYDFDPQNPVGTIGGNNLFLECGPQDQTPVENRTDVLVFDTDPFAEDTAVFGQIKVSLEVATNCTDTDFTVKVTDVYPDGRSLLVTDTSFRMRWRNEPDTPEWLTPGQRYVIDIPAWTVAQVFAAGHRLRLAVSSSNSPRFGVNRNNGKLIHEDGPFVVAHNSIFTGSNSSVSLPVVDAADIPKNVRL